MLPYTNIKIHAVVLSAVLALAHTAAFVLMLSRTGLDLQHLEVLNNAAWACRGAHEMAIRARVLDSFLADSWYVPGLRVFKGPRDERLREQFEDLLATTEEFKHRHHGVYLGVGELRRLDTKYGLRSIWDAPELDVTLFYDIYSPSDGLPDDDGAASLNITDRVTVKMGLWDLGNLYVTKALDVYQQGLLLSERGVNFTAWSSYRFMRANGVTAVFPAYLRALDALVEITAGELKAGYVQQLGILLAEGCVLSLLAALYMWYVAGKIPVGLTRGLALMSITLEAEDEEEEDDGWLRRHATVGDHRGSAPGAPNDGVDGGGKDKDKAGGGKGEGAGSAGGGAWSSIRFHFRKSTDGDASNRGQSFSGLGPVGTRGRVWGLITRWLRGNKVAPATGRRNLVPSRYMPLMLVLPVLGWALLLIAVSVAGEQMMHGMDASVATFNIVHTFVIRFHRALYYTLELCSATSWAAIDAFKSILSVELERLKTEYTVMLFGNKNDPALVADNHFRLVHTGVLFGGETKPAQLIYHYRGCLAEPDECQPEDSPFYSATVNGLDVLVRQSYGHMESLIVQQPAAISLNSSDFEYVWATSETDMEGGLNLLVQTYYGDVQNRLRREQRLQIALFSVIWIWVMWYLFLQLRPLLARCRRESKRMAELLCQLPNEVDVETLVARAIGGAAAAAAQQQLDKQAAGGRSSGPTKVRRRSIQFFS
ncbi:hypothetical protein GPECTOR_22g793 [Gonium pectorale]|uniref:Uncharacterized protein n=1 Tax=Gonium pectorale TaxID=33097 RepID=A0A150GHD5_GONPE|nr:hypothetical protein GPECTOR_22g793 [Gonium pectorale]|eukprot:KXZ49203.1 hypothetical protein GPECTOR_22g793 [Gonium pectorale]